eukprot:1085969-Rhodomonas_salina.2
MSYIYSMRRYCPRSCSKCLQPPQQKPRDQTLTLHNNILSGTQLAKGESGGGKADERRRGKERRAGEEEGEGDGESERARGKNGAPE